MAIYYNGINHFAISVANLEESIDWYSRVWGLTVLDRSEIPGQNTKVSHMQGKGFILEIFESQGSAPLPEYRKFPNDDFRVQGNLHMSFGVPDGPKALEEMKAMGVEIVFIAEVDGTWGCFIHDNSGNLIEIFEEKGDNRFNQELRRRTQS